METEVATVTTTAELMTKLFESGMVYALMGAAVAVILSGIGSCLGIRMPAQASAGAMSEDPTNFGK